MSLGLPNIAALAFGASAQALFADCVAGLQSAMFAANNSMR